ncbi:hypothetical protein CH25_gp42 [Mycobacterium phage EagleEye]|uniref:Uncharacterized protein n=1 Tax=Mycobacterium phage EagleEye TaxID=1429759 RepID=W0LMS4_9CAUD|nr:hypothetical protein CH25_gp42 [Mycobacterium phage EagleEye]AHG23844.1 hypothetical protein PBI_EAGLEEYE_64 [Mycobacterium phage EagleEye]QDK03497.1 hypothetical protein SEA_LUCYEDI_63 [Mycobacterium phage Lucyedi]QNJ55848.1 hypothetical protein SEA_PAINTERBOY_63 [Mycobacterium phage PainterBoy]
MTPNSLVELLDLSYDDGKDELRIEVPPGVTVVRRSTNDYTRGSTVIFRRSGVV